MILAFRTRRCLVLSGLPPTRRTKSPLFPLFKFLASSHFSLILFLSLMLKSSVMLRPKCPNRFSLCGFYIIRSFSLCKIAFFGRHFSPFSCCCPMRWCFGFMSWTPMSRRICLQSVCQFACQNHFLKFCDFGTLLKLFSQPLYKKIDIFRRFHFESILLIY